MAKWQCLECSTFNEQDRETCKNRFCNWTRSENVPAKAPINIDCELPNGCEHPNCSCLPVDDSDDLGDEADFCGCGILGSYCNYPDCPCGPNDPWYTDDDEAMRE